MWAYCMSTCMPLQSSKWFPKEHLWQDFEMNKGAWHGSGWLWGMMEDLHCSDANHGTNPIQMLQSPTGSSVFCLRRYPLYVEMTNKANTRPVTKFGFESCVKFSKSPISIRDRKCMYLVHTITPLTDSSSTDGAISLYTLNLNSACTMMWQLVTSHAKYQKHLLSL